MTKSTWVSVDDKLPSKGSRVLGGWRERDGSWACEVVDFYGPDAQRCYWFDSANDAGMYPPVSHWMPLPEAPGEEE